MYTWKVVATGTEYNHEPYVDNITVLIQADTIEDAIEKFYGWYTLGEIMIVSADTAVLNVN